MKTVFAFALILFSTVVQSQNYPNKPIRWVVPYTGGGITDNVTRMVTQKMQAALGQPIIVDNKPGANSIIGADLVAKSAPDGYSILIASPASISVNPALNAALPFWLAR